MLNVQAVDGCRTCPPALETRCSLNRATLNPVQVISDSDPQIHNGGYCSHRISMLSAISICDWIDLTSCRKPYTGLGSGVCGNGNSMLARDVDDRES